MKLLLNQSTDLSMEHYLYQLRNKETGEMKTNDFTGKPVKRLPNNVKLTWFKLANKNSRIAVTMESLAGIFVFKALVYENNRDENPISEGYSILELSKATDEFAISNAQLYAVGQALNFAGYGCEVDAICNIEQFACGDIQDNEKVIVSTEANEIKKATDKTKKSNNAKKEKIIIEEINISPEQMTNIQSSTTIVTIPSKEMEAAKKDESTEEIVTKEENTDVEQDNQIAVDGKIEELKQEEDKVFIDEDEEKKELDTSVEIDTTTESEINLSMTFDTTSESSSITKYVGKPINILVDENASFMRSMVHVPGLRTFISDEVANVISHYLKLKETK